MKKITIKFMSLFLSIMFMVSAISFGSVPTYASSGISICVDGDKLDMDVSPIIMEGRTMVPVRAVSEAVGCKVDWFGEDRRIVVYSPAGGDPILVMIVNDSEVTRNYYNGDTGEITGEVLTIDAPPVIVNGRTMIPLRFIAETIGYDVEWDSNTKTVFLYSANY